MATFQPCPGIASVVLQVSIPDSDQLQNVLHVSNGGTSAWTAAQLTTLVNAVDTWITTGAGTGNTYAGLMGNYVTVTGIVARDLTTSTGPGYTKSVSHAGTNTNGRVASGLAFCVTLRSGLSGRSQRGRVFMGGCTTDQFDSTDKNLFTSNVGNGMTLTWNSLIAAVTAAGAGWSWVILSRYELNPSPPPISMKRTSGIGTAVASVGYADLWCDYQRRRAPAHGRHH